MEEKGEEKTEAEEEGRDLWGKLVELIQTAFREGEMVEEATRQTVVLIPKGKKEYRGIGLVEVTWKVVAAILHRWLTTAITYHDAHTRFLGGLRYWDCHPQGQAASAACSHEGGSPICDLPGPDQGV